MIEIKAKLSTNLIFLVNKCHKIALTLCAQRCPGCLKKEGLKYKSSSVDHPIEIKQRQSLLERLGSLLHTLFNKHCYLCDESVQPGYHLCPGCQEDLPANHHHCEVCALPMHATDAQIVCGTCLKKPPPYQRVTAPLLYQFPVDAALKATKYQQQLFYLRAFLPFLVDQIDATQKIDILVPIPMHWRKRRKRGQNHAEVLAKLLSKQLDVPVAKNALRKTSMTISQASLSKQERIKNLRGSFQCNQNVSGMHIAIVDDVVTTGATIELAAKLLRQAGAKSVEVWALARTPKYSESTKH